MSADGTTTATVPNVDPVRRRVGLGVANNGTIYQAYFTRVGMGPRSGGIATLDLTTGAEPVLLDGFGKPASVLVDGMDIFVSDQDRNRIVQVARRAPSSSTTFAMLDSPDILTTPREVHPPGACTGPSRSPIPAHADHPLRPMPITDSGHADHFSHMG